MAASHKISPLTVSSLTRIIYVQHIKKVAKEIIKALELDAVDSMKIIAFVDDNINNLLENTTILSTLYEPLYTRHNSNDGDAI